MSNEDSDKKRNRLLEKFISTNNISAFKKILSYNPEKEKKKNKEVKTKIINNKNIYKKYRSQTLKDNVYNNQIKNYYTQNDDIENYKLNKFPIFNDPDFKEKQMRGNNKWASIKFDLMKMNWAKRKGIAYEHFQVPKVENFKKRDSVNIDGGIINGNNRFKDFDNPSPEDVMLSKNADIINNYLNNNIFNSRSLKLPKIHFGNKNGNYTNNHFNAPRVVNNVNINFEDYVNV